MATFIAGPCVIESMELLDTVAQELVRINQKLGTDIIFKASFDKANRTSSIAAALLDQPQPHVWFLTMSCTTYPSSLVYRIFPCGVTSTGLSSCASQMMPGCLNSHITACPSSATIPHNLCCELLVCTTNAIINCLWSSYRGGSMKNGSH